MKAFTAMTTSPSRHFKRTALTLGIAAVAGCAAPGPETAGTVKTAAVTSVPPATSAVPIADFSAGLRCMDDLLLDFGTRELLVVIDDTPGQSAASTQGNGTREALAAALSDMSQRSRTIRVAAGGGSPSLSSFPASAPEFALRGAITQSDERTLTADFSALTTKDLTLVPGAVSHTQATLSGASAEITKIGRHFSLGAGNATAPADARRALADVGAIEIIGRLAKLPYWTCLGASNSDPAVAAEIRDWYDAMAARPAEIIEYFQRQLKQRGVYDGPLDGAVNAAFKDAVARYRAALGMSREPKLSKELFAAHLQTPRRDALARLAPATAPATPAPAGNPPLGAPLGLRVASDTIEFRRGQTVQLWVRPTREAYVYCFMQDENHRVTRFFPNRFTPDARVGASGVQLPGKARFEIRLNTRGTTETVSCFATERDVLSELPASVGAGDLTPLPVAGMDQVRLAFSRVGGGALVQESLQARPR
jgi:hypothetical protein